MMWSSGNLSPRERLAEIQRARRAKGLPDYSVFCDELIAWVSRGGLTAEGAVEWIKLWSKDERK
jgi:hypothetical protein